MKISERLSDKFLRPQGTAELVINKILQWKSAVAIRAQRLGKKAQQPRGTVEMRTAKNLVICHRMCRKRQVSLLSCSPFRQQKV